MFLLAFRRMVQYKCWPSTLLSTNFKRQKTSRKSKLRCHYNAWVESNLVGQNFHLTGVQQRCRWDFKSGWASSNVVGIICPPCCNMVNWAPKFGVGLSPPCPPTSGSTVQWNILMNISALNDQMYILRNIFQICVPPWHSWGHVTSIVERRNL